MGARSVAPFNDSGTYTSTSRNFDVPGAICPISQLLSKTTTFSTLVTDCEVDEIVP